MATLTTCIICKNKVAKLEDARVSSLNRRITCPVCGVYDTDCHAFVGHPFPIVFSGIIRNFNEIFKVPFPVSINVRTTLEEIQRHMPYAIPGDTDIPTKADLILHYLRRHSLHPGIKLRLSGTKDYSLGFCQNNEELHFCAKYLETRGLIEQTDPPEGADLFYRITPAGWIYLSGIGAETKDQGFIAMAFTLASSDMLHVEGLIPGIKTAGYVPMRIDRKDHNNRIDDEIVAEIRKSKFVVADLTGKNAGAYFEAGFAMGLDKPVIWTCQQSEIDAGNVHFDTRQYSIVSWDPDNLADFAKRLTQRIEATIGHGRYVAEVIKPDKE